MISPKKQISKILQTLPDDSSYDEILKELAFAKMVDRGLQDSKQSKAISNDQMKKRIKAWQK